MILSARNVIRVELDLFVWQTVVSSIDVDSTSILRLGEGDLGAFAKRVSIDVIHVLFVRPLGGWRGGGKERLSRIGR